MAKLYALVTFQVESWVFAWDQPQIVILLLSASHIPGFVPLYLSYWLRWGPPNFFPRLSLDMILLTYTPP
jgi:hypothetical protein